MGRPLLLPLTWLTVQGGGSDRNFPEYNRCGLLKAFASRLTECGLERGKCSWTAGLRTDMEGAGADA